MVCRHWWGLNNEEGGRGVAVVRGPTRRKEEEGKGRKKMTRNSEEIGSGDGGSSTLDSLENFQGTPLTQKSPVAAFCSTPELVSAYRNNEYCMSGPRKMETRDKSMAVALQLEGPLRRENHVCACAARSTKVLLVAYLYWMNSFKKNGKALRKKNILIVTAHPDDESMFFTPTINYLTSRGHYIHILCLSIGDADSKGSVRKRELFQACATLKVPMQQVKGLDHSDLQDGFGKVWNHKLVANLVKEEIDNYNIDMIITFDNYGVLGHCNHRDVHYGVCKLLYDIPHREIEAWELVSTNILRKYSGPVDVWLSMFVAMRCFIQMKQSSSW
ncbi:hypothetical protein K1719_018034 [Acacia pycnantha]|nr:hypothetical protein K1719_018034 [Acacia pycnantha]